MNPRTQIASQQLASLVSCLDAASVADDAETLANAAVSLADSLIRALSIRPPLQLADLGTGTDGPPGDGLPGEGPAATIAFPGQQAAQGATDDDIPF